jgi:hypothetical protein
VQDQVANFFDNSGCDYLVLSFAWGDLSNAHSRASLERFATKVMPEFASRMGSTATGVAAR